MDFGAGISDDEGPAFLFGQYSIAPQLEYATSKAR